MRSLLFIFIVSVAACNHAGSKKDDYDSSSNRSEEKRSLPKSPTITGQLKVALNTDVWEGELWYRYNPVSSTLDGIAYYLLDSIKSVRTTSPFLASLFQPGTGSYYDFGPVTQRKTDTTSVWDFSEAWVSQDYDRLGRIIIEDVNFDGFDDLLLYNSLNSGATNRYYDIWLYNPGAKSYSLWEKSTGLGLWDVNREQRTLTLGYRANAAENYIETWNFTNATLPKLVVKEKGYLKDNDPYVKREEHINGAWTITYNDEAAIYTGWLNRRAGKKNER
jgi:hypothetical protein